MASYSTGFIVPNTTMEQSTFALNHPDLDLLDVGQPQWTPIPSRSELLRELDMQRQRGISNAYDDDVCDGLGLPRHTAACGTTTQCQQTTVEGRYRFAVENHDGKADGQLKMNIINGYLSVTHGQPGELFIRDHVKWITNQHGDKIGDCFTLRSSSNQFLYLSVDCDSSDFVVRGMRLASLCDESDCYWTDEVMSDKYRRLRYWGNYFHDPSKDPYYFVIEPKGKLFSFKLGTRQKAAHLGVI